MSGNSTHEKMVAGAVVSLAKRGVQGTSFTEVLQATGAPRGSIYHHFPGGKDQLVGEAVDLAGERALAAVRQLSGSPAEVTAGFTALWRAVLVRSDLQAGCSVTAVTVSAGSGDLLDRAGAVFRAWTDGLTAVLAASGVPPGTASGFAATLIAATEGAVVMARAAHSLDPFEAVAAQLVSWAGTLGSA